MVRAEIGASAVQVIQRLFQALPRLGVLAKTGGGGEVQRFVDIHL